MTLEQELQQAHALSLTQASQLGATQRAMERSKTREAILSISNKALLQYVENVEPSAESAKHFALVCEPAPQATLSGTEAFMRNP